MSTSQRLLSINVVVVVIGVLAVPLLAKIAMDDFREPDFQDARVSISWMRSYYKNPQPELVAKFFRAQDKIGSIRAGSSSAFAGFLAGAIKSDPSIAKDIIDSASSLSEGAASVVARGIAFSGLEQSGALLANLRENQPEPSTPTIRDNQTQDILNYPIEKIGGAPDMFLGYYVATGNEVAIAKIASTILWLNDSGDNLENKYWAVRAGANLTNMAKRDPKVLEVCQKLMENESGDLRGALSSVIDWAKSTQANLSQKQLLDVYGDATGLSSWEFID